MVWLVKFFSDTSNGDLKIDVSKIYSMEPLLPRIPILKNYSAKTGSYRKEKLREQLFEVTWSRIYYAKFLLEAFLLPFTYIIVEIARNLVSLTTRGKSPVW